MTDFKIVDVPTEAMKVWDKVVDAMRDNLGKAVEIPIPSDKDLNTVRKSLRESLNRRGLLSAFDYKTKTGYTKENGVSRETLIVWLATKEGK